jgi:hypothetical protein
MLIEFGNHTVKLKKDAKSEWRVLNPKRSQKIVNHSPDGFAWGYGGSGPAQLALALLLEFADEDFALKNYQDFKWKKIASLQDGTYSSAIVTNYIEEIKSKDG